MSPPWALVTATDGGGMIFSTLDEKVPHTAVAMIKFDESLKVTVEPQRCRTLQPRRLQLKPIKTWGIVCLCIDLPLFTNALERYC